MLARQVVLEEIRRKVRSRARQKDAS